MTATYQEQRSDYSRRQGLALEAITRWLTEHHLNYSEIPIGDLEHLARWVRSRWETAADDWNYSPRGPGLNWLPCFICGADGQPNEHGGTAQTDMSAFVRGKDGGERIVALFEQCGMQAKLDFRDFEPSYVQVKIGACVEHEPNLLLLWHLTSENKTLTAKKLEMVKPGMRQ